MTVEPKPSVYEMIAPENQSHPHLFEILSFDERVALSEKLMRNGWRNSSIDEQSVLFEMLFYGFDAKWVLPLMGVASEKIQVRALLDLSVSLAKGGLSCSQMVSPKSGRFVFPTVGARIYHLDQKAFGRLASMGAIEWRDWPPHGRIENSEFWNKDGAAPPQEQAARTLILMAYEDSMFLRAQELMLFAADRAHVESDILRGAMSAALEIAKREASSMLPLNLRGVARVAAAAKRMKAPPDASVSDAMAAAWLAESDQLRAVRPWLKACVAVMDVDAEGVLRPMISAMVQSEPRALSSILAVGAGHAQALMLVEHAIELGALGCLRVLLEFGAPAMRLSGALREERALSSLTAARNLVLEKGTKEISALSDLDKELTLVRLAAAIKKELESSGKTPEQSSAMIDKAMAKSPSSFSRARARSAFESLAMKMSLEMSRPQAELPQKNVHGGRL